MTVEGPNRPEEERPKKEPKKEVVENFLDYAQRHTRDMLAYILMIVGIVWSLFNPFYGGVLIGLIAGFYFSKEIVEQLKAVGSCIEEQGIARSVILGGLLLVLFLRSPGIFIGLAIGTALTEVVMKSSSSKGEE